MQAPTHLILALAHVAVVVLVVGAVTFLALGHEIPADAVVGLFGAAIGASGNAALSQRAPARLTDPSTLDAEPPASA